MIQYASTATGSHMLNANVLFSSPTGGKSSLDVPVLSNRRDVRDVLFRLRLAAIELCALLESNQEVHHRSNRSQTVPFVAFVPFAVLRFQVPGYRYIHGVQVPGKRTLLNLPEHVRVSLLSLGCVFFKLRSPRNLQYACFSETTWRSWCPCSSTVSE